MTVRLTALILLLCTAGCADNHSAPTRPPAEPAPLVLETKAAVIDHLLKTSNYRPSEAAIKAQPARLVTRKAPLITQSGEIVVMEGSALTITAFDDESYGLVLNQGVQNPMEISKELLATYPDEFDAITVFTTFPDGGSAGSVAWYLAIRSSVLGTGAQPTDSGAVWGSQPGGKLHGFINMQYVGKYGSDLSDPSNYVHSVMGQEFGHRWGTFLQYADATGQPSEDMLGRDGSHWASTLQANGSVMDGNEWQKNDDGTFWLKASNTRFSELDQYIMGLRGPEEVPDWFLIRNATYQGSAINPEWPLPSGVTVQGTAEVIDIDKVIAVHGPRVPDHLTSPRDFRVAIVLVTRPGESQATVDAFVERLEGFRTAYEQIANQMSDGRMSVCTQVSAPCDSPGVAVESVSLREHEGNGDGLIDPGETVAIDFTIKSTGFGDAPDVSIELGNPDLEGLSIITPIIAIGDIPHGESKAAPEPLLIKIPPTIACGELVTVPVQLETDGRKFPDRIRFDIGVETRAFDGLDRPDDWTINPYGTDNADEGQWEVGEPTGVDAIYLGLNLVTQPAQDHSLEGVNALVTGAQGGEIASHDVDGGYTTALSPVYDLTGARDPLVTWYSWHFAYNFNSPEGVVAAENDALWVEGSTDGGLSWETLDIDATNTAGWTRKTVRIAEKLPAGDTLQLRFTIGDNPVGSVVEGAIDDIRVWDESLVCRPELTPEPEPPVEIPEDNETSDGTDTTGGSEEIPPTDDGGCSATGHGPSGVWWMVGLVLAGLALRRRQSRWLLALLVALSVGACSDDKEAAADVVAPQAEVTVADVTGPEADVEAPKEDVPPKPDPFSGTEALEDGPSFPCLRAACATTACEQTPECAAALDCLGDCDTLLCATECLTPTSPPFLGFMEDALACGSANQCFAGGSGISSCGNGTCEPDAIESFLTCPADCEDQGDPEVNYECMVAACDTDGCAESGSCDGGLQCLSTCHDKDCSSACISNVQGGFNRNYLRNLMPCAVDQGCLPADAWSSCGDDVCELSESQLNCPEDCGEAPPGYMCLVDKCNAGVCAQFGGCNNRLLCVAGCEDKACVDDCLGNSQQASHFILSILECGAQVGCVPPEVLGTPEPVCGNNACELTESTASCPGDCDPAARSCVGNCNQVVDEVACHCSPLCAAVGNCCSDYFGFCANGPFACLIEACPEASGCAQAENCSEALGCIASSKSVAETAVCSEGQPEQNIPLLEGYAQCAADNGCLTGWPAE